MSKALQTMSDEKLVQEWNDISELSGRLGVQSGFPMRSDYLKEVLQECRKRNILV